MAPEEIKPFTQLGRRELNNKIRQLNYGKSGQLLLFFLGNMDSRGIVTASWAEIMSSTGLSSGTLSRNLKHLGSDGLRLVTSIDEDPATGRPRWQVSPLLARFPTRQDEPDPPQETASAPPATVETKAAAKPAAKTEAGNVIAVDFSARQTRPQAKAVGAAEQTATTAVKTPPAAKTKANKKNVVVDPDPSPKSEQQQPARAPTVETKAAVKPAAKTKPRPRAQPARKPRPTRRVPAVPPIPPLDKRLVFLRENLSLDVPENKLREWQGYFGLEALLDYARFYLHQRQKGRAQTGGWLYSALVNRFEIPASFDPRPFMSEEERMARFTQAPMWPEVES